ncbi:MAG: phosphotransferase [Patescibacteria group bacterium]
MNINEDKLNGLLNGTKVRKILQGYIKTIGDLGEILEVRIKPIKTYLDSESFSLVAVYKLKIKTFDGDITVKKIFASAHPTLKKKRDYEIGKSITTELSKNPARFLKIPKSYVFIQSHGLYLREYVEGETLGQIIKQENGLPDNIAEPLALSLIEFQKIKILPSFEYEARANFADLNKNISILEKQQHPRSQFIHSQFIEVCKELDQIAEPEIGLSKVLSHGDFNPSNFILTADKRIAFLDFGSVGFRNYLWDVARLCSSLKETNFLDIYSRAKGHTLGEKDDKLFTAYQKYFNLLDLTHVLVWGL